MSGASSGVKMDRLESSEQQNNADNLLDDERKRNPSNVNDKVGYFFTKYVMLVQKKWRLFNQWLLNGIKPF